MVTSSFPSSSPLFSSLILFPPLLSFFILLPLLLVQALGFYKVPRDNLDCNGHLINKVELKVIELVSDLSPVMADCFTE